MSFNQAVSIDNRRAASMRRLYNALLLLAIPFYLFLNLFTLRGVPYHIVSDDGLFALDGLRMIEGRWIYRDFFQFNSPGIDYIYFFAFKLFGARTWVPNLITLLIGTFLSWLTLHLSRRIMPRHWADLSTVLFVVFVYGRWLDATHHWVSLFAILLAINVILTDRSPSRLAIAGVLIGMATFFTQTSGVVWLIFAASLFYEQNPAATRPSMARRQASLFLAAALTWSALSASTLWHVGWRTLWYYQVTFPQRYELRVDSNPIGVFLRAFPHAISFLRVENIVVYLLLVFTTPFVLCVLLWKAWRNQDEPRADRIPIFLLSAIGLLLMAQAITRLTWIRLYADFLPTLIVFFATIASPLHTRPRLRRLLLATLWSALLFSAVRQTIQNRTTYSYIASLPAGKIALQRDEVEEFRFIAKCTHPDDLFFELSAVRLYLPLRLNSPIYMDYLRNSDLTRPEFLLNVISALETNHVRYIALLPATDKASNPTESHHLDPLYSWITSRYTRIQRFPNNEELWELRP